jgi:hypothetical protein
VSALMMNAEPFIWREVRAPLDRGLLPTLAAPAATAGPPEEVEDVEGKLRGL